MKIEQVNLSNIKSFIQGYARTYYDKIFGLPAYTKEQIYFRLYVCKDDCLVASKCKVCQCSAIEKSYSTSSCNLDLFPNLMSEKNWEQYKLDHKIDNDLIEYTRIEVEKVFEK